MATKLKDVDVVLVGMGWTGGIMAKELAAGGLKVVGLERGAPRGPADFALPYQRDELKNAIRLDLMQSTAVDTLTVRNRPSEEALPMRRLGSFLLGDGLGGAGMHWNGQTWRWLEAEHRMRSHLTERYGAGIIPVDMAVQDIGIPYDELEPYYDKFERTCGISGKAGNIKGEKIAGGNVFEGPRSREYPNPPLKSAHVSLLFEKAAKELGYHPFPMPAANASQAYTNPDGQSLGACQYCGHCERFGCEAKAKASPNVTVLPVALANPNFELRTNAWVTKVLKDDAGRKATGVLYTNVVTGEEFEQPAGIVILCAYVMSNVHLMLLSGIGKPYDAQSNTGVVGRNYCYQTSVGVQLFFKNEIVNPFMGTGSLGYCVDDFNGDNFDHGGLGFIGGAYISCTVSNGRPIAYRPVPPGTPRWGSAWKKATADWYNHSASIGASGSSYPSRGNFLDLDPTYRNAFGQPLLRMTFNFTDNDRKMSQYVVEKAHGIAKAMKPDIVTPPQGRTGDWSVVPYQTTHNTGGTAMGTDLGTSVVNRYSQSWDLHNLFVLGASTFPQNNSYNPTGPVGALAYWAADAILKQYVKDPRPLA